MRHPRPSPRRCVTPASCHGVMVLHRGVVLLWCCIASLWPIVLLWPRVTVGSHHVTMPSCCHVIVMVLSNRVTASPCRPAVALSHCVTLFIALPPLRCRGLSLSWCRGLTSLHLPRSGGSFAGGYMRTLASARGGGASCQRITLFRAFAYKIESICPLQSRTLIGSNQSMSMCKNRGRRHHSFLDVR